MKASIAWLAAGLLTLSAGQAPAQGNFSGTWALDRDISADLTKASFEPPKTPARRNTGFSGGFGGRGGFGGSRRTPADNGGRAAELTVDERTRLRELTDYVKGLTSLVIAHSDQKTFSVTDAKDVSHLYTIDGAKIPVAFATATVDSTTQMDGAHVVTTYTVGPARTLVFTYVLVPATSQMALRIRLDESGRPRADVPELRLVYRQTH